jgi:hypothetical protein
MLFFLNGVQLLLEAVQLAFETAQADAHVFQVLGKLLEVGLLNFLDVFFRLFKIIAFIFKILQHLPQLAQLFINQRKVIFLDEERHVACDVLDFELQFWQLSLVNLTL